MSDLLVTPRGTSRAAAAAAALSSGFIIADRLRPYVEQGVNTLKRAYGSLRDQSQVRYGPGSGRYRREQELARKRYRRERESVKKKLDFETKKPTKLQVPTGSSSAMSNAVQFQRFSDRIGRKKRRTASELFTAEVGRMNEVVFRWQQVSESLLGPGENIIAYGKSEEFVNTGYVLPIMFTSLTNQPMFPANLTFGCQRRGLHRATYDLSTRAFGHQYLTGQNAEGAVDATEWTYEQGSIRNTNSGINPRMFHKWTDIRLNLYGSQQYPLVYEILVVTGMALDMSPFDFASGGQPIFQETNLSAWFRDHTKDYIGNPIVGSNLDRSDFKGKFRVIRRKIVRIDPLSYADAAYQNVSGATFIDSSNVKNINMFIRHDRFRDYAWTPLAADQDLQNDLAGTGFDRRDITATANTSGLSDVDRDERVYLFIKCTAPTVIVANEFNTIPAEAPVAELAQSTIPKFSGSYDIVLRNCFRYSSST